MPMQCILKSNQPNLLELRIDSAFIFLTQVMLQVQPFSTGPFFFFFPILVFIFHQHNPGSGFSFHKSYITLQPLKTLLLLTESRGW
jgi:hypothetical protein